MSWQLCAARVEAGDPDRFAATMIAPVAVRAKLFPLYALNLALAEAAWASSEPLVCMMRLQFWQDALLAFRDGRVMPAHDLTPALAETLTEADIPSLLALIDSRRREAARDWPASLVGLIDHLDKGPGALMDMAVVKLGAPAGLAATRDIGRAQAVANWLVAVPALVSHGAQPLPGDALTSVTDLARAGLAALNRADQTTLPRASRAALWPAFAARIILDQALRYPQRVLDGELTLRPLRRSLALLGTRITCRV